MNPPPSLSIRYASTIKLKTHNKYILTINRSASAQESTISRISLSSVLIVGSLDLWKYSKVVLKILTVCLPLWRNMVNEKNNHIDYTHKWPEF